jgi:hypothetical protein
MISVKEAREQLERAQDAENRARQKKFLAAEVARKEAAEKALKAYAEFETKSLSVMIGRTVLAVKFDGQCEGTIEVMFTDGSVFFITASGDDATSIVYGMQEAAK